MNREELEKKSDFYRANEANWRFYIAAFNGYKELINLGLIDDFEDSDQYTELGKGYGVNYTQRIIELITGFISESPFAQNFEVLGNDQSWINFYTDCDLYGTDFDVWWNQSREIKSCYGLNGILVTQPSGGNPSDLSDMGVYPYITSYSPLNIFDFKVERDEFTARPRLTYLKLFNDDNTYTIWDLEKWQVWQLAEDEDEGELISEGVNELGEIPFVFDINLAKPGTKYDGVSLVKDIAPIDANLIRSFIRLDNIEHLTCFPMFVTPKEVEGPGKTSTVKIGPGQIHEYAAGEGIGSNPVYWLSPESQQAIQPIRDLWADKKREIYDMSYLSSIVATSESKSARSGESLKELFRPLAARLSKMVDNEAEARRNVVRYWLKWQNKSEVFEKIEIKHNKDFDIEKLIQSVDDLVTEKGLLNKSETAQKELDKEIVRSGSLKNIPIDKQRMIMDELDKAKRTVLIDAIE